ncbi:MAG: LCP family protein, partial [Eubacterium sp.]|nr:LCP family protein [Eubacterium sp.]
YLAQQDEVDGEYHYRKANAAFAYGGAEEAIRMLNTNLDLNITDYVTVDFQALIDTIDIVGGIEITITEDEAALINTYIDELENWTDGSSSHLDGAGTYTLDGIQATAYCRIRKTAKGDFGRAQRQRIVLGTLFKKVKSAGLGTVNEVIDTVFDEVETSLTNAEILGLATTCIGYDIGDTTGFPGNLVTMTLSSAGSVDVPCTLESNLADLYEKIFDVEDYEASSTVQEISDYIINVTGCTEEDGSDYGIEDDGLSETDSDSDSDEDSDEDEE